MSTLRAMALEMARERVPARWLGAEMRVECSIDRDAFVVKVSGMPEPIVLTGEELLARSRRAARSAP